MVTYAVTVARTSPERAPARIRIPSYAVWETVVFVLNILAFIFIGLQIRPILDSLEPSMRWPYFAVALAILVTVIVVRVVWHMFFNTVIRWRDRRFGFNPPRPMLRPTVGSGLVVSWAGMRGIVSLAAALALPAGFPFRDLILLTAFSVVLGTLVIQGLTSSLSCARSICATTIPLAASGTSRANAPCAPDWRPSIAISRRPPKPSVRSSSRIWEPPPPIVEGDDRGTARFIATRLKQPGRLFSNSGRAMRSAMMRSI